MPESRPNLIKGMIIICVSTVIAALTPYPCRAIVTSDHDGTHQVQPGASAFGINLDGVAYLETYTTFDAIDPHSVGTGALLWNNSFLLTAAHIFDDYGLNPGEEWTVMDITFKTGAGDITRQINIGNVIKHDNWQDIGTVPSSGGETWTSAGSLAGFDLALIPLDGSTQLELAQKDVEGYQIAERHRVYFDEQLVVAGFGNQGNGIVGEEPNSAGTLRAGLNRYDDFVPFDIAITYTHPHKSDYTYVASNFDTQLAMDFDS